MPSVTYEQYCEGLDKITDLQEAGVISVDEMNRRLDGWKAATGSVPPRAPARRPPAPAPARPAASPAVTLTTEQFRRLVAARDAATPAAAPAPPPDPVAERHARTVAAVITALAQPQRLSTAELGGLVAEAGSIGHGGPFYAQEEAPPLPQLPPPTLASARELASLPLQDFCTVAAGQITAEQESGAHRAPFWRAAAR